MHLNSLHSLVFTIKGICVIGSQCVKKSLKYFYESKSDFCNSINFTVITRAGKSTLIKIESVFRTVYLDACREVLSNGSVETFI